MKKALAILIVLVMIFGWVITLTDFAGIGPIKDRIKLGLDLSGGVYVVMEAQTDAKDKELQDLMNQTQAVIENRVNQMGLSEPVVTIEGGNKIRVEMPGVDDPQEAVNTIGKTAQLQFLMADGTPVLDGSNVKKSSVQTDSQDGGYAVTLKFDSEGADAFYKATSLAASGGVTSKIQGAPNDSIVIMLDDEVISAPSAHEGIEGGEAIITGGFTEDEAMELSLLISAGSLPVNLVEVETSQVGATLGLDALQNSIMAGAIGVVAIFILMLVMYRALGFIANVALLIYIPVVLWILVLFGAVLTLPGIAGIILSIGMAVDANVIIFARIKEEVRNGKSIRVAVHSGFKRAMATVIDSHVTTIIAGIVLYMFGTGPVKGFAFTLIIGIIVSLVTAVLITHLYVILLAESKRFSTNRMIGVNTKIQTESGMKHEFHYIKHRKIYYIVTIVIIVVGLGVGFIKGFNMGIDFTGGTRIELDMGKKVSAADVNKVLEENGIDGAEIINYGEGNKNISIKTTESINTNERTALMDDMKKEFGITDKSLLSFEQFGPSVGELLTQNALKAIAFAAVGMLIYIIIRFEWKFGVSAIIGTAHDVLIMLAFYGLFSFTINNPFIAGLLTVVGYSINDTIVIFDRIRENLKIKRKKELEPLIDLSINQTLIRSLTTSATTILVMIPLIIWGGEAIRQFAIPLLIGIVAGAASSIFICSPIYYELCQLTGKRKYIDKPKGKGKGSSKKSKSSRKKEKSKAKGDGAVV